MKDGNKSCHFVQNYKLKLINCGAFFNNKELSSALTESIGSSTFSKKNENDYTTTSGSVIYKYDEVSGKIAAVNEPQENQSNYNTISIDL